MARIGTIKLATTVYIVNIGSGETSLNMTLVPTEYSSENICDSFLRLGLYEISHQSVKLADIRLFPNDKN